MKTYIIRGIPHIVKAITNERVIFQALTSNYYNNPSFKIKFDRRIGYYITIPDKDKYKDILLTDIFRNFEIYNKLKTVEQLREGFI